VFSIITVLLWLAIAIGRRPQRQWRRTLFFDVPQQFAFESQSQRRVLLTQREVRVPMFEAIAGRAASLVLFAQISEVLVPLQQDERHRLHMGESFQQERYASALSGPVAGSAVFR
jgi:hypothetical protein